MKNTLNALVNDGLEFELDLDKIEKMDLIKDQEDTFHLLVNNKSYQVKIDESNFNDRTYSVIIDSNPYRVRIKSTLDTLIKKMGYSLGSSKAANSVKAPMPGIIIDINVAEGQNVKEGDTLLILEAMKMENAILCPKDAIVKKVTVETGDTVDKNKLLVELD